MLENFKRYFPTLAEEMVEYLEDKQFELLYMRTRDGEHYVFDNTEKSIKRLPNDSSGLSEAECRAEFGRRLRHIMTRQKVTQSELSEITGIPQSMLSNYIAGKSMPGFYNVDKIAKALKCSVDDFRYL